MSRTKRSTRAKQPLQNFRTLAIAKVEAAKEAVEAAKEAVIARTGEARSRASEVVSSLEKVFEQRVSGAISRLGVPTAKEVRDLSRQVAQLKASVERLRRARA
jgi:poly(hydroxyalkanoate) granule-associated protein